MQDTRQETSVYDQLSLVPPAPSPRSGVGRKVACWEIGPILTFVPGDPPALFLGLVVTLGVPRKGNPILRNQSGKLFTSPAAVAIPGNPNNRAILGTPKACSCVSLWSGKDPIPTSS